MLLPTITWLITSENGETGILSLREPKQSNTFHRGYVNCSVPKSKMPTARPYMVRVMCCYYLFTFSLQNVFRVCVCGLYSACTEFSVLCLINNFAEMALTTHFTDWMFKNVFVRRTSILFDRLLTNSWLPHPIQIYFVIMQLYAFITTRDIVRVLV